MKQILQSLKTGETEVADIPCPRVKPGTLLVRTGRTLVSAGTERMLVQFGKSNLIDKARQQPDKVRMVLDKIRTDGLPETLEAVRFKLDQPLPLGYCNVGTVVEVGAGVSGFAPGDRVVSNGQHAEMVLVPKNLCAKVPDGVSDEAAAFTVLGAIGLQGIRLVQPTLGECVVVTGLGLIGLMAVQLLRAHGCRVLGLDFDPAKLALARQFGAEVVDLSTGADPVAAALAFSRGAGVDAVIITASTKSSEPVSQAANMCRKRGRIVLVGVTGLELSRADFYEKELSFQVSCSYGPGRYDPAYEQGGQDYPIGYVRWTEQRNFEAILDMMQAGAVDTAPLVSHRFPMSAAKDAYDLLSGGGPSLGILLEFPPGDAQRDLDLRRPTVRLPTGPASAPTPGQVRVGVVGIGNYAARVLVPAFRKGGAALLGAATSTGIGAFHFGRKLGFAEATTDTAGLIGNPEVDAVVIATRHDTHGRFVVEALRAGKHVFVEKPLAITPEGVDEVEAALRTSGRVLTVGFNRRFAPHVVKAKALLARMAQPASFVMTVNAGAIPADHWTQDPAVGGGRIIGEGCHFIDLLRHLAGAPVTGFKAVRMGGTQAADDKATITLEFADGSFGTFHYLANGHKSLPKERLEIFCAGAVLQLDNFRVLRGFGWPGFGSMRLWRQDKGQEACAAAFLNAVRAGGPPPIPVAELLEVSRLSIEIGEALRP